jgi:catechol 2,3-dioxygenase-like lactoylglutathione lyase family enzyme
MLKTLAAFNGFSVDDLAKAKQFYTETLGLGLASEEMGLQLQLPGGGETFVYEKADHQPATYTMLNFVVADIGAAVDELTAQGVVFERYEGMPAPQDEKGILHGLAAGQGPDIAWFKDPAGNILAVLQDK